MNRLAGSLTHWSDPALRPTPADGEVAEAESKIPRRTLPSSESFRPSRKRDLPDGMGFSWRVGQRYGVELGPLEDRFWAGWEPAVDSLVPLHVPIAGRSARLRISGQAAGPEGRAFTRLLPLRSGFPEKGLSIFTGTL